MLDEFDLHCYDQIQKIKDFNQKDQTMVIFLSKSMELRARMIQGRRINDVAASFADISLQLTGW